MMKIVFFRIQNFLTKNKLLLPIIALSFWGMIMTLAVNKLIAENSLNLFALTSAVLKGLSATATLLFIICSWPIWKELGDDQHFQIDKNLNIKVNNSTLKLGWLLLNFFATYFFLSLLLSDTFYLKFGNEFTKIIIASILPLVIGRLMKTRSEKEK